MKKIIIGAVVGGIILFLWQFLSWSVLNLHSDTQQYSPKQTEILKYLDENLDAGFYYMPTIPPEGTADDLQKLTNESIGKPWAEVRMHKTMTMNMGANMSRGLVVDILIIFLLSWVIMKMGNPSMQTILLSSLAVGLISYLSTIYVTSIWFEFPTRADLMDAIVSFGLVGFWLSWWLRR